MTRIPPKKYRSREMCISLIRPMWYMDFHKNNHGTKLDEEIYDVLMKFHRVKCKKYLKIMDTIPDRATRREMIKEIEKEYDEQAEALEVKYHDKIKNEE